jgi:hypothetical protein
MGLVTMWRKCVTVLDSMPSTRIALRTVRGLLSAVLRVMSELGIFSFLMMSKTSTHDCISCVFHLSVLTVADMTTSSCLGAGLPWSV